MSLSHAILVSLLDGDMTGYDLARKFDTRIGFFWKASHQQIYQELRKMEQAGLVSSKPVVQSGRPNKNLFALSADGMSGIETWMEQETVPATAKDDLLVKVFAMGRVNTQALVPELERVRTLHQDRLALYRKIEAKTYSAALEGGVTNLPDELKGKYLCLRRGIHHERGWIDWCDEALEILG